ncbi:nicotinamidase [Salinivibrio sp. AR647]|uniref:isochorismatase family protein n=1 Tax=Salinivibrio sp. AR647 TaxID=1909438 RepID=UPI0009865091|nr:isochorismatase family protein [Salinivibrio sp. AR647]OOE88502.1 nicotinamidase [Salinivibrio sp. AR647]
MKQAKIAAIDVDAQRTFTPLCPDELPVPEGDTIGPALNEQATLADVRVLTKDAHPANAIWMVDDPADMLQPLPHKNADLTWVQHAVPGTKGFETIDALPAVTEYHYVVWKGIEPDLHPYGACFHDIEEKLSTGLIEWLHSQDVETVIVGGLATDYCVKTTAIQLKKRGRFDVVVNLAACRGINAKTVSSACDEMLAVGIKLVDSQLALRCLLPR